MRMLLLCAAVLIAVATIVGPVYAGDPSGDRRARALEKWDANGDGTLDESERAAMKDAMQAKRAELIEKYDADGDGKLSREERQAAIDAGDLRKRSGRGKRQR